MVERLLCDSGLSPVPTAQVPENRMFPSESVVVLNAVLSAAALARDQRPTGCFFIFR
jgi:hypothetical protein